jgi:hypothetical protein
MRDKSSLADDLVRGAELIGDFIYGEDDPTAERKVYHNAAGWPFFKDGNILCAFKSELRKHAAGLQEDAAAARERAKGSKPKTKQPGRKRPAPEPTKRQVAAQTRSETLEGKAAPAA